jgi:hypothetical protein
MALAHQKAVIALLLSAPSTLHKHWKANDRAAFDRELDRLNFSTGARTLAVGAIGKINGRNKEGLFQESATILRDDIWKGDEPHPTDEEAARLAGMARVFDNE